MSQNESQGRAKGKEVADFKGETVSAITVAADVDGGIGGPVAAEQQQRLLLLLQGELLRAQVRRLAGGSGLGTNNNKYLITLAILSIYAMRVSGKFDRHQEWLPPLSLEMMRLVML